MGSVISSCLKALGCCSGSGEDTTSNNTQPSSNCAPGYNTHNPRETEQVGAGSGKVGGSRIEVDLGEKLVTGAESLDEKPPATSSAAGRDTDIDSGGVPELGRKNATPPQDELGNGGSTNIPNGITPVVSSDPLNPEPSNVTKDSMSFLSGASDTKISGEAGDSRSASGTTPLASGSPHHSESPEAGNMSFFSKTSHLTISGGSFTNVINSTHSPPLITLASPSHQSDKQEIRLTESEIYARNLLPKRNGYPLWQPDVSMKYKNGVSIGDVSYVDVNGRLHYLFNILHPASDPVNGPNRVPPNFEPLRVSQLDLNHDTDRYPNQYATGELVCNSGIAKVLFNHPDHRRPYQDIQTGYVNYGSRAPEQRFRITAALSEGAILVLPEGGSRTDYLNEGLLERYAAANAISWYVYANSRLGRYVGGNALMLVTGMDETKTWGVASFTGAAPKTVELEFVPVQAGQQTRYQFRKAKFANARTGPENGTGLINQCIFVRGFRVAVQERGLLVEIRNLRRLSIREIMSRSELVPFQNHSIDDSSPAELDASGDVRGLGRNDNTISQNQSQVQLESGVDVQNDEAKDANNSLPERLPYHPGAVINDFFLNQFPDMTVALTHDKTWFELLMNGEDTMPNDEELINRLKEKYDFAPSGQPYIQPVSKQQDRSNPSNLKRIPSTNPFSRAGAPGNHNLACSEPDVTPIQDDDENDTSPDTPTASPMNSGDSSPEPPLHDEVEDDSPPDSASPIKPADSESPLLPTETEQRPKPPPTRVESTPNGKTRPQQPKYVGPAFPEPVADELLADAMSGLHPTIKSEMPNIGNSSLSKPCRACSQHDLNCDKVLPVCKNCRDKERECNYSNNGAD